MVTGMHMCISHLVNENDVSKVKGFNLRNSWRRKLPANGNEKETTRSIRRRRLPGFEATELRGWLNCRLESLMKTSLFRSWPKWQSKLEL
ncbi:hypothetical protein V6N11_068755 [Hibiscus sabdariffa]|uniref:Uncharacterized protein n=1 Tax=Hibiscus sabdariffa TaxID=183260 RepID=A0ABR2PB50_9ROSI